MESSCLSSTEIFTMRVFKREESPGLGSAALGPAKSSQKLTNLPRLLMKTISSRKFKKIPYSRVQGSFRNLQLVGAANENTNVGEVKAHYSEDCIWSMAWGLLKLAPELTLSCEINWVKGIHTLTFKRTPSLAKHTNT